MEINFVQIASAIFVLSCASLTCLFALAKWQAFTYYELHRPRWAPPSVCVFCIGFWISFCILVALYVARPFDLVFFISPFASASLTRWIYEDFEFKRR